jgi:hypothetical protein
VPIGDRADWSAGAEEIAELERLRQNGFTVEPSPVPIVSGSDPLRYGIDFDSSNRHFDRFRFYLLSGLGTFLGERAFEKQQRGPFFSAEILAGWADPALTDARLAIVTPDWQEIKVRRTRIKIQTDFVIDIRLSGDRDITEFQSCWRNCGVMVPAMATFAGPGSVVFDRTNLFGRVRSGRGYKTALLVVNGSGYVRYARQAPVEVSVLNNQGAPKTASFQLPPLGWRLA